MKRDDFFPGKYLKAADLNGKAIVVTIEHARPETLKGPSGEAQKKLVLYFAGKQKAMPLNLTNFNSVATIAGEDTTDWPGHKIELYPTRTEMSGKTVDCIRIRRPQGELALSKAKASKPAGDDEPPPSEKVALADDLDDEIPF